MNKLRQFAIMLCSTFCICISCAQAATPSDRTDYSLKTVEAKPIPKREFFDLWTIVALKMCGEAKKNHNIVPEQCRTIVEERQSSCETALTSKTPTLIGNLTVSRQIGREYLNCVTPGYFCRGVEVKTETEARERCK